jgi:hypothetical protein
VFATWTTYVNINKLRIVSQSCIYVLCDFQSKQELLPQTALTS